MDRALAPAGLLISSARADAFFYAALSRLLTASTSMHDL